MFSLNSDRNWFRPVFGPILWKLETAAAAAAIANGFSGTQGFRLPLAPRTPGLYSFVFPRWEFPTRLSEVATYRVAVSKNTSIPNAGWRWSVGFLRTCQPPGASSRGEQLPEMQFLALLSECLQALTQGSSMPVRPVSRCSRLSCLDAAHAYVKPSCPISRIWPLKLKGWCHRQWLMQGSPWRCFGHYRDILKLA